ncbi:hypothetical protein TRICI_001371 [Trichomonascus ciferrii]|uniref:F-box domain-containing protein n=1 Tax=Trichomonascus ciferrii TaxID=44093 RepID=A0A642V9J9_9ASCO|nr:hypothetical protein TRICI_001371 [Trichomonascus ciferrii]
MKGSDYPDDVLVIVFRLCSMKDLISFRLVARQWKSVVDGMGLVSFYLSDFCDFGGKTEKKLWLVLSEKASSYQWESSAYAMVPETVGWYKWKEVKFDEVFKSGQNGLDFALTNVKTVGMRLGGGNNGLLKSKILIKLLKMAEGVVQRPRLEWLYLEDIVYPEQSKVVNVIRSSRLRLKAYASFILSPVIMAPVILSEKFTMIGLEFGAFSRSWGIYPSRTFLLKPPVEIIRIRHTKLRRNQSLDIAPIWKFLNGCERIDTFILECRVRGAPPNQKIFPPVVRKLVAWNCGECDLYQVDNAPLVSYLEEIHGFYDCGLLTKVVHPNLKRLYARHPRDGFWVPMRLWHNLPAVEIIATDHENDEVGIIPMLAAFQFTAAHTLYYKLPFGFNFNPMILQYLMRLPTLRTLHLHLSGAAKSYYLNNLDTPNIVASAKDLLSRIILYCPDITTLTLGGAFDYYFSLESWLKPPNPRTTDEFNPFNERSSSQVDLDLFKTLPITREQPTPTTPLSPTTNPGSIILD